MPLVFLAPQSKDVVISRHTFVERTNPFIMPLPQLSSVAPKIPQSLERDFRIMLIVIRDPEINSVMRN